MKEAILQVAIESLRQEGLKFSVDSLSDRLKISKKPIYKHFSNKETLAFALYEKYYSDAIQQAEQQIDENTPESHRELLRIYWDSKAMTSSSLFNKYKLNQTVSDFTVQKADLLWATVVRAFGGEASEFEKDAMRMIVDGAFEKLCQSGSSAENVIERLMNWLW